ncbi:MAG TPA: HEAT repeat domain-containing protein [Allosphingosinicella sp.]|nr:HEAT repeat domain-containing protein [Allosphingosinicella sp.]
MIAGAALSAWLADRQAQGRSSAAVRALAARWSAHPLIRDLHDELDAMTVKSTEAVEAAARRFLAREDEIRALVDDLIAAAAADPFFQPPFLAITSEIHSALLLFEDPSLSIALGVAGVDTLAAKKSGKRGPTSIGFTGLRTLFRFVKSGGSSLSFWEAPPLDDQFVGEGGGKCRLTGRRRLEDGELFVLDGRTQSFVIEHATSDAVYLQAVVKVGTAPLSREYDSATLEYVGASSTDEESSRVQMMVSLLRMMDRTDAVPVIRESLKSPHFHMRWHVMRELLALDAEAALPDLRDMAESDPHPEVRAAAAQALAMFFGPPEEEAEVVQCRA